MDKGGGGNCLLLNLYLTIIIHSNVPQSTDEELCIVRALLRCGWLHTHPAKMTVHLKSEERGEGEGEGEREGERESRKGKGKEALKMWGRSDHGWGVGAGGTSSLHRTHSPGRGSRLQQHMPKRCSPSDLHQT